MKEVDVPEVVPDLVLLDVSIVDTDTEVVLAQENQCSKV
jgi:hypothetical protein